MRREGDFVIIPTFEGGGSDGQEVSFDLTIPDDAKKVVDLMISLIAEQLEELEENDAIDNFYVTAIKN